MALSSTRKHPSLIAIILTALALTGLIGGARLIIQNFQPILILSNPEGHLLPLTFSPMETKMAFSPDGTKLLSTVQNTPIRLWDLTTGTLLREFPEQNDYALLAFAPDGHSFALRDGTSVLRRWEITGKALPSLGPHPFPITTGLAYSPDGKWLAISGVDFTRVWDARTGKRVYDLTPDYGFPGPVAFSPDSRRLASGSGFGIGIWDVSTGKRLWSRLTENSIDFLAFSPDGRRVLVSGGGRELRVKTREVWDVETGHPINGFSAPDTTLGESVFTPNGKYILMYRADSILVIEAATGRTLSTLVSASWQRHLPDWLWQWIPAFRPPPPQYITGMALSPDGKRLAYATGKEIRIIPCNFR